MAKKFVRLRDAGSMFINTESGQDISGPGAKEMTVTDRLNKAIKGGVLITLEDKDEADKWNKSKGVTTPVAATADTKEDKRTPKEINDAKLAAIEACETVEAVEALIVDEKAKNVLKAAEVKIEALKEAK